MNGKTSWNNHIKISYIIIDMYSILICFRLSILYRWAFIFTVTMFEGAKRFPLRVFCHFGLAIKFDHEYDFLLFLVCWRFHIFIKWVIYKFSMESTLKNPTRFLSFLLPTSRKFPTCIRTWKLSFILFSRDKLLL